MKATQVGSPAFKPSGQKRSKGERLAMKRKRFTARQAKEERRELEQEIMYPPPWQRHAHKRPRRL